MVRTCRGAFDGIRKTDVPSPCIVPVINQKDNCKHFVLKVPKDAEIQKIVLSDNKEVYVIVYNHSRLGRAVEVFTLCKNKKANYEELRKETLIF